MPQRETHRGYRGDKPPVGGNLLVAPFELGLRKYASGEEANARRAVADIAARHERDTCRLEHCPVCIERASDVLQALGLIGYR